MSSRRSATAAGAGAGVPCCAGGFARGPPPRSSSSPEPLIQDRDQRFEDQGASKFRVSPADLFAQGGREIGRDLNKKSPELSIYLFNPLGGRSRARARRAAGAKR